MSGIYSHLCHDGQQEWRQDPVADQLRNLHQSQYSGKGNGGRQDKEDWRVGPNGFHQDFRNFREIPPLAMMIPDRTDMGTTSSGKLSSPPSMERIT